MAKFKYLGRIIVLMAKPIAPTPTLSGEDAEKVLIELNEEKYSEEKAVFLEKCRESYRRTLR